MSEKPIILSTPMVQAILTKQKTQTRRVIKPQPISIFGCPETILHGIKPRYLPDDVLWVRETWAFDTGDDDGYGEGEYVYRADNGAYAPDGKWHSSTNMPRAAARIFLRVKDVRVERLQEIGARDIAAELGTDMPETGDDSIRRHEKREQERLFQKLWDNQNAKRKLGWESNPWVWAISFKQIDDERFRLLASGGQ